MELTGVSFNGRGKFGDFSWMIEQPEYADALFVFNDNEEQFLAFRSEPRGPGACSPGGGNAVIRPYQCAVPQRASGMPTGSQGRGYQGIDDRFRKIVDRAVSDIRDLIESGRYSRVFYSADDKGYIGTGIFNVAPENRVYITKSLILVTAPEGSRRSNDEISEKAARLASYAGFGIRMSHMGDEPVEMQAEWLDYDPEKMEREDD